MNKLKVLLFVILTSFTGIAVADFNGNSNYQEGGFTGDSIKVITVEQAKKINGKAWVKLRGNIIERAGEDDYIFKDKTGSIRVEIDSKYWQGRSIGSKDNLEITGELENRWNSVEIDVKNIEVLK